MNTKLSYPIVLSASLLVTGCAGLGKEGRIGKNDGSDPCYLHLERVDSVAAYYKDDRMKTIAGGAFLGAATGAAVAALVGGDTTAVLASAGAGAVVGGFAANAYWNNKLQQAHNSKDQAIDSVAADLQAEVQRMTQVEQDVNNLAQCRIKQRDRIRKEYADKTITKEQAQAQWDKWGQQTKKDAEEMAYLDEALNNLDKMNQAYQYASTAIDTPEVVDSQTLKDRQRQVAEEKQARTRQLQSDTKAKTAEISRRALPRKEKAKLLAETKRQHKEQQAALDQQYTKKADMVNRKVNPKSDKIKTLVASMHEKHESIKKGKSQVAGLAAEGANKNGFEQITGFLQQDQAPLVAMPNPVSQRSGLSCLIGRQTSAAGT